MAMSERALCVCSSHRFHTSIGSPIGPLPWAVHIQGDTKVLYGPGDY
jgi:hypothetical protein